MDESISHLDALSSATTFAVVATNIDDVATANALRIDFDFFNCTHNPRRQHRHHHWSFLYYNKYDHPDNYPEGGSLIAFSSVPVYFSPRAERLENYMPLT